MYVILGHMTNLLYFVETGVQCACEPSYVLYMCVSLPIYSYTYIYIIHSLNFWYILMSYIIWEECSV